MSRAGRLPWYSYDEYRWFEEATNAKHEYLDGQILAMAGGTPEHAALTAVVSHRERAIERRWRDPDGTWRSENVGRGGTIELPSIAATLAVDAIYERSPVTSGI